MKREDQTVTQCKQPIRIKNLLQCLRRSLIAAFVKKKIMLPFSKAKSWLKTQWKQQTICKFLISSARGRKSTKVREVFDVSNTWSSSIAGDKVHVRFVASSQMHTNQPIMPSCYSNICTNVHLILTLQISVRVYEQLTWFDSDCLVIFWSL